MRVLSIAGLVLLAACGGGGGGSTTLSTDAGPAAAVDQFMRAVADSNISAMSQLWGTPSGSAAETGRPENYPRRLAIVHAYLKGTTHRVVAGPELTGNRAVLLVEVTRQSCTRQIPFTVARTGNGRWLVEQIDLGTLGSPGRACPSDERRPPG